MGMSMSELKSQTDRISEFMGKKRIVGDCQARGLAAIAALYAVFPDLYHQYDILAAADHQLADLTQLLMEGNTKESEGEQEKEADR